MKKENKEDKKEKKYREKWQQWALELQSLAQAGLEYNKIDYDRERYERIREISAEIVSYQTNIPFEKVKKLFCNEVGYQTPKLESRAAIFKNNKILLVKERDDKWSLPGGWVDVYLSVEDNTIKEVKEEAGLNVRAKKIIAIQDGIKNNGGCGLGSVPYGVSKVFVLCSLIEENEGKFEKNIETSESNFFGLDELPELSEIRNTKSQIEMCFKAKDSEVWETIFD